MIVTHGISLGKFQRRLRSIVHPSQSVTTSRFLFVLFSSSSSTSLLLLLLLVYFLARENADKRGRDVDVHVDDNDDNDREAFHAE